MTFFDAFIYLLAAVVMVPVAQRLGLGSVLGYLLAGMAIGPFGLGLVGGEGKGIMHFAEFGVVMMLFLIGLELRPALLWSLRGPILGLGGLQVCATAGVVTLLSLFLPVPWQVGLATGLILAMSSTAIVLQSLGEKGQLKTPGGQACFSVLLFQDIAVIPIIALLPLLATLAAPGAAPGEHQESGHSLQPLLVLGAVAAVILSGRFLLRPLFAYIAKTKLREMFTATALLLVIGIALLMQKVGLSAALGTFLAGVVLAESEYRHQLEADLEPFKGLLLGLFFISVGASIDFALMGQRPGTIAALVVGLVAVKMLVLFALGRVFRLERSSAWLFAFALAQGGEFCFVLLSFAERQGVLPPDVSALLVASVAVSMALAPILFTVNDHVVQPRFVHPPEEREPDVIQEHENPVLLAGFGRFGHVVGRLLRSNGFPTTVLDHDPDQVEALRRFGLKSYYGDATRLDLLHTAGAPKARLFIIAIDNEAQILALVALVRENFPHLPIMARANSRQHAYELIKAGVTSVYRETLGSALDLGVDALRTLGVEEERAHRAARIFREHDEASVRAMALIPPDDEAYVSLARKHIENLERALRSDEAARPPES